MDAGVTFQKGTEQGVGGGTGTQIQGAGRSTVWQAPTQPVDEALISASPIKLTVKTKRIGLYCGLWINHRTNEITTRAKDFISGGVGGLPPGEELSAAFAEVPSSPSLQAEMVRHKATEDRAAGRAWAAWGQ